MANEQLEIFKLINNPNSKVIILLPLSDAASDPYDAVQAFLSNDFGFDMYTEWGTLAPTTGHQQKLNAIVAGASVAVNALQEALGFTSELKQRQFLSLFQTVSTWEGSTKPTIQLPLFFMALRPLDDVRQSVFKLLKGIAPIKESGLTLLPPFGYNIAINWDSKNFGGIKGTCSLKIGKWFEASRLLIKGVSPVFSKETTPNGLPLFARVMVTFEPAILWTVEDILGLFPGLYEQSLQYEASPGEGASSTGEDSVALNSNTVDTSAVYGTKASSWNLLGEAFKTR